MQRFVLIIVLLLPVLSHAETRIVSLAPHLTEWVYSLDEQENLVGVSAYSDYPKEAEHHPVVADYQGVNLSRLMQVQPTLVLAWEEGNKPQDIARIQALGIPVFLSNPNMPEDIASELNQLAKLLNKSAQGQKLASAFLQSLTDLRNNYQTESPKSAFFYSWTTPLMTVGNNAWHNQLLAICGARTAFFDSEFDYPTVSIQQVIAKQPTLIVNATKDSQGDTERFWQKHRKVLNARIISADPDVLSRYTLRLIPELQKLCKAIDPHTDESARKD